MKITDILDITDKAKVYDSWQVLMKRDEDGSTGYYIRAHTHPAIALDKESYWGDEYEPSIDQDGYYQPDGTEDVMEHRVDKARYIAIAPEMESKLRSIVDMLPEIKTSIRWLINTYQKQGSPVAVEKDLLAKLEQWENE